MPAIYSFDPLVDNRWPEFLDRRDDSSVFHRIGWLAALQRTYGYRPIVFTTSPPQAELADGIVFCEIKTWLSARRLVSIPFADHAAPLVDDSVSLQALLAGLKEKVQNRTWKYLEMRPISSMSLASEGLIQGNNFCWHRLDLSNNLGSIFSTFHKNCVQRKIKRAERENLSYMEGRSDELIKQFYKLLLVTRRRHGLPPQPISWFRNLCHYMKDAMTIRVVSRNGLPIASIVTMSHGNSMVYKYGVSDPRFHNLGGTMLLLWRAIQDAKSAGLTQFDMGRSDSSNSGLINFKEHWGAERSKLVYWGYPGEFCRRTNRWVSQTAKVVFSKVPTVLLPATGRILYRHIG